MTDKIKNSFDSIRAEEELKSATVLYLQNEIIRRKMARKFAVFNRRKVSLASAITLFIWGIFAYNMYFTPAAYVDLDVNPSIELILNKFDKVIDIHAYNDDGADVINNLSLTHKSCEQALVILMESMTKQGYFKDDALVSVTLQINKKDKEQALLDNIQMEIQQYMTKENRTAQIDVFPVTSQTLGQSQEQGVSPAKYLAIQELIEVDPTASVENCRGHSISEIKKMAQAHGNHHNTNGDNNMQCPQQDDIRHNENNCKGHH